MLEIGGFMATPDYAYGYKKTVNKKLKFSGNVKHITSIEHIVILTLGLIYLYHF